MSIQPAFGAKINVTPYLAEGLHAASSMKNSTIDLSRKADFVKALELIKNDKNIDTFEIKGAEGSKIQPGNARLAEISVNGAKRTLGGVMGVSISDAAQCIEHVIDFAESLYGQKVRNNPVSDFARELERLGKNTINTLSSNISNITNTSKIEILDIVHNQRQKMDQDKEEFKIFDC